MNDSVNTQFLFVEKYRPKTIDETILPEKLKNTFKEFIKQGEIPNLILSGPSGVGKTTVAKAMLNEIGCDYYVINGSLHGNIDTLRNDISNYASTYSFNGSRKYVILDEADFLNPNSTMPALRNFMEEYSNNCGFILTCNYLNRIIPALHSRCSIIEFKFTNKEVVDLCSQFLNRLIFILDKENISYDKKALVSLIKNHYPDWRRILNEVQRYSVNGKIDSGIIADSDGSLSKNSYATLISLMKEKKLTDIRKWIADSSNNDSSSLFEHFYNNCSQYFKPESIPVLIILISKYQYQAAFVASQEINMSAFCIEVISECSFK